MRRTYKTMYLKTNYDDDGRSCVCNDTTKRNAFGSQYLFQQRFVADQFRSIGSMQTGLSMHAVQAYAGALWFHQAAVDMCLYLWSRESISRSQSRPVSNAYIYIFLVFIRLDMHWVFYNSLKFYDLYKNLVGGTEF